MTARWTQADLSKVANKRSPNKFNARKKEVDGIVFDSTHEAEVYQGLKLRVKAGEIAELQCHTPIRITINGEHVFTYECDFVFRDQDLTLHYQDAKGYKKGAAYQLFRLKKAVIRAALGIEIEEV